MRIALLLLLACWATRTHAQNPSEPEAGLGLGFANAAPACSTPIPLPPPRGPYAVGVVTYHWVLPDRLEPRTPDPDDLRQVIVKVLYPAARDASRRPMAYMPELDLFRAALRASGRPGPRGLDGYVDAFACVETASFAAAPLDRSEAPYPLVLMAPGGNMSRHWYTALAQDLTSHGYVVAVISHPFSGLDLYPAGGLIGRSAYYDEDDPVLDEALTERLIEDVHLALDRLLALSEAEGVDARLAGQIDPTRIAVVGHSRGGRPAGRGCAADGRFRACVTYDSFAPDRAQPAERTRPEMHVRRPWETPRAEALHRYLAASAAAAYDVVIRDAGHFSFSDLPSVAPRFFDAAIAPARAHRLVSAYTLTFLDKYLRGQPAPWLDDASARPADVVVRAFETAP